MLVPKADGTPTHVEWQSTVAEALRLFGWRYLTVRRSVGAGGRWVTTTSRSGWPDIFAWHARLGLLAVELKVGRDRLSPDQRAVLAELTEAGVPCAVWRPDDDWDEVVGVLSGRKPIARPM